MKKRVVAKAQKEKNKRKRFYAYTRGAPFKGQDKLTPGDTLQEMTIDMANILALQRFMRRRGGRK